jgi:hypothetical protein
VPGDDDLGMNSDRAVFADAGDVYGRGALTGAAVKTLVGNGS